MVEPVFSFPIRVYWEDTDAGGVVYHANYLAFLERARTEWLRAHGIGQHGMRTTEDLVLAVRSIHVDFIKPARLDDVVHVTVAAKDRRGASFTLDQELFRGDDCLLRASVRIACLQASTFRPRPLPSWLIAMSEKSQASTGDASR